MIICSPQLGLSQKSVLGGEVFDRQILSGLAKKGVKVEIIIPNGKLIDKNPNWRISAIPISHFPPHFFNLFLIPYLLKIYIKTNFQILRLHQPQFMFLPALLIKLHDPKIKIVATYHQFKETNFSFLSNFFNNYWDHIICDSIAVKEKISKKYHVPKGKITVVHNGTPKYLRPTKKDKLLSKKLKIEGKTTLLFMGFFIKRKNPLFLIDVLAQLLKRNKNIVILFWGQGPLKDEIIKKAKNLNVEKNIRIIDPLFGPEKNNIHNVADIFVHPALDEGFALAPLESMACAKPIVMTDGFSAREAVDDGKNGLLCKQNNLSDWTNKLNRLISDANLQKKMGIESLKKTKEEFNWNVAVEEHIKVFKKLVSC